MNDGLPDLIPKTRKRGRQTAIILDNELKIKIKTIAVKLERSFNWTINKILQEGLPAFIEKRKEQLDE